MHPPALPILKSASCTAHLFCEGAACVHQHCCPFLKQKCAPVRRSLSLTSSVRVPHASTSTAAASQCFLKSLENSAARSGADTSGDSSASKVTASSGRTCRQRTGGREWLEWRAAHTIAAGGGAGAEMNATAPPLAASSGRTCRQKVRGLDPPHHQHISTQ